MILIDSNENIVSSAIRNRLQATYPDELFLTSRRHTIELLPSLTRLAREGTLNSTVIRYFAINEYPFNVYQVYEQIKTILRTIFTLPAKEIHVHVIVKLNMQDLRMADQLRHQCAHLGSLVGEMATHGPCPVRTFFSCVYNVFGTVHSSIVHTGSNNVQTLLYLLHNPTRQMVIPFRGDEDIVGTDVDDAVTMFLKRPDHPESGLSLQFLPVNRPVKAQVLIDAVVEHFQGRYHSIKFSEGPRHGITEVEEVLKFGEYAEPIQERIINYLYQS